MGRTTSKTAHSRGDLDPHVKRASVRRRESAPKLHLDRFSRFAGHVRVTTHRHTDADHATRDIRSHIYTMHAIRPKILNVTITKSLKAFNILKF